MLDYHAHTAALRQIRSAIKGGFSSQPTMLSALDTLCHDADLNADAATLGCIVDIVVDHASSDGLELSLLQQAADLWAQGRSLYDQLANARSSLEQALLDPAATDAVQLANSALSTLMGVQNAALSLNANMASLKSAVDPLAHIKAHPRQSDVPEENWGWRDVFLGRRTDAFVESLFRHAKTKRASAFAFGALSSYSANVAGSAYLGCVVGGPRRLHRFRDRLARNSVGAWLHSQAGTLSCTSLARAIAFRPFGVAIGFPSDIQSTLKEAMNDAWPNRTGPDWDLGLSRTVRHLQLLDQFQRPDIPSPPPPSLISACSGMESLNVMNEQDPNFPTVGVDTDGNVSGSIGQPDGGSSQPKSGSACLAVILVLITVGIALLIYCIGQWSEGKKCKPGDFFDSLQGSDAPDPRDPTNVSQQQLSALADPSAACHIVNELFSLQMMIWQGFDTAAGYLGVSGLIYPDEFMIASPLYQQFLKTPPRLTWPLREDSNAATDFQFDPPTSAEQPAAANSPFPSHENPMAFAGPWSPQQSHGPTPIAQQIFRVVQTGSRDHVNRDLDADRGYLHPCWAIEAGHSIHDATLAVEVLSYDAD